MQDHFNLNPSEKQRIDQLEAEARTKSIDRERLGIQVDRLESELKAEREKEKTADVLQGLQDWPEFRGLWRSHCLKEDGTFDEGWSVTFVKDGEYCDMHYQPTPQQALEVARRLFGKPIA